MNDQYLFDDDSLTVIIEPLVDFLSERCFLNPESTSELHPVERMLGDEPHDDDRAIIQIFCEDRDEADALNRYLRTLFEQTASESAWMNSDRWAEEGPKKYPIRFSVVKKNWGLFDAIGIARYLVAECSELEFDRSAAQRQIQMLTDYLSDLANIRELSQHESSTLS